MTEILNGPPQFILLVLITGMIAFYSGVLNNVIAKRKSGGATAYGRRLTWLSRLLFLSEITLLLSGYIVVARIGASIFMRVDPWLDFIVIITVGVAHIALSVVFIISYCLKDSWRWVW